MHLSPTTRRRRRPDISGSEAGSPGVRRFPHALHAGVGHPASTRSAASAPRPLPRRSIGAASFTAPSTNSRLGRALLDYPGACRVQTQRIIWTAIRPRYPAKGPARRCAASRFLSRGTSNAGKKGPLRPSWPFGQFTPRIFERRKWGAIPALGCGGEGRVPAVGGDERPGSVFVVQPHPAHGAAASLRPLGARSSQLNAPISSSVPR